MRRTPPPQRASRTHPEVRRRAPSRCAPPHRRRAPPAVAPPAVAPQATAPQATARARPPPAHPRSGTIPPTGTRAAPAAAGVDGVPAGGIVTEETDVADGVG